MFFRNGRTTPAPWAIQFNHDRATTLQAGGVHSVFRTTMLQKCIIALQLDAAKVCNDNFRVRIYKRLWKEVSSASPVGQPRLCLIHGYGTLCDMGVSFQSGDAPSRGTRRLQERIKRLGIPAASTTSLTLWYGYLYHHFSLIPP